ncbi:hypothetical protein INT45_005046 [Circinella minor]|uniref:FAD-binding domain-containing protein n=1 Tax=Circinella minor TaxID=1195481 RepID=A0A8H7SDE0_9FUNG|nr:hypothetical protein INT45_005046 [Circinella minor]
MDFGNNNNSKNRLPVLIIGGGISGLVLANVLQAQGVPYKVFERDLSPTSRSQGWAIGLDFGLAILKATIGPEKYDTLGKQTAVDSDHPERGAMTMVDGNANKRILMLSPPPNTDMFRINRTRLRAWLLKDIMEADCIVWNKIFESYTIIMTDKEKEDGSGKDHVIVEVTFTDGTTERGSILVGADGTNSHVCRQLIGSNLFEQTTLTSDVKNLASSYWIDQKFRDEIVESYGPAHVVAPGSGTEDEASTCMFFSLVDVNFSRKEAPYHMMWSMSYLDDDDDADDDDNNEKDNNKKNNNVYSLTTSTQQQSSQEKKNRQQQQQHDSEKLLKIAKARITRCGFSGPLLQLVMETPQNSNVGSLLFKERSPCSSLQEMASNTNNRIVLIGDSSHSMIQLCGSGGNHAIADACFLGSALASAYKKDEEKALEEAVYMFYKETIPRGQEAVVAAHKTADAFHGTRETVREYMNSILQQASSLATIDNTETHCWKKKMDPELLARYNNNNPKL